MGVESVFVHISCRHGGKRRGFAAPRPSFWYRPIGDQFLFSGHDRSRASVLTATKCRTLCFNSIAILVRLFAHLDQTVGSGNYVVAFSADHGVAPIPEEGAAQGLSGGRFSTKALPRIAWKRFSTRDGAAATTWPRMIEGDLWLASGRLRSPAGGSRHARGSDRSKLPAMPGVARVFRSDELAKHQATHGSHRARRFVQLLSRAQRRHRDCSEAVLDLQRVTAGGPRTAAPTNTINTCRCCSMAGGCVTQHSKTLCLR